MKIQKTRLKKLAKRLDERPECGDLKYKLMFTYDAKGTPWGLTLRSEPSWYAIGALKRL